MVKKNTLFFVGAMALGMSSHVSTMDQATNVLSFVKGQLSPQQVKNVTASAAVFQTAKTTFKVGSNIYNKRPLFQGVFPCALAQRATVEEVSMEESPAGEQKSVSVTKPSSVATSTVTFAGVTLGASKDDAKGVKSSRPVVHVHANKEAFVDAAGTVVTYMALNHLGYFNKQS